jgi:hypothetical protein
MDITRLALSQASDRHSGIANTVASGMARDRSHVTAPRLGIPRPGPAEGREHTADYATRKLFARVLEIDLYDPGIDEGVRLYHEAFDLGVGLSRASEPGQTAEAVVAEFQAALAPPEVATVAA